MNRLNRRYHLHLPGIIYIALVLLVGLAAARHGSNLLVWVFGAMLGAVLLSGVVSGAMLMGLRVRRLDPRHGAVGEPLIVRYAATNRSRIWPIFNIHLLEQTTKEGNDWSSFMAPADAWVMHIGSKETVHGEAVLHPTRRGRATFNRVRVWTTFPFSLIKKSVTFNQQLHTLIYPRLYNLRENVLAGIVPSGPTGTRISQRAGQGEEYFGMRDYRPGDTLRRIAWKRGVGRDELISIERTQPSPPQVRVVLNLSKSEDELRFDGSPGITGRELQERAISLAATVVRRAEQADYEVGVTLFGCDEQPTPLRRGHWHVEKIMAALASIDLDTPPAPIRPGELEAERVALVVIHPARVEPEIVNNQGLHLSATQLEWLCVPETHPQPAFGERERMEIARGAAA